MKDEVRGKNMMEYCALKSKMYSFLVAGARGCKKAKGVKKSVVEKTMGFADYLNCLRNSQPLYRNMRGIRSYNHQVLTID